MWPRGPPARPTRHLAVVARSPPAARRDPLLLATFGPVHLSSVASLLPGPVHLSSSACPCSPASSLSPPACPSSVRSSSSLCLCLGLHVQPRAWAAGGRHAPCPLEAPALARSWARTGQGASRSPGSTQGELGRQGSGPGIPDPSPFSLLVHPPPLSLPPSLQSPIPWLRTASDPDGPLTPHTGTSH